MSQDTMPPLPRSSSSSSSKGCLIGCLIVFVIGVAGSALMGYVVYRAGLETLNAFTETEPQPIPEVAMTDGERDAVTAKMEGFVEAVKSGESEEKTFVFTGQELNVLIRSFEDPRRLGESVYLTIENGEVKGEVSLNLGQIIPISFLEGRYANGAATFSVNARDGRLFIFVEQFQVKGKDAPPDIVEQFRQTNLADDAMGDPEFQNLMENIESIAVEDDRLVVTLK